MTKKQNIYISIPNPGIKLIPFHTLVKLTTSPILFLGVSCATQMDGRTINSVRIPNKICLSPLDIVQYNDMRRWQDDYIPWWRHPLETFYVLLALGAGNWLVTAEFPAQRPVTRGFHVFFDLCLNKRVSKQSWGWCFQAPSRPLRRHCNVSYILADILHHAIVIIRQKWTLNRCSLRTICQECFILFDHKLSAVYND